MKQNHEQPFKYTTTSSLFNRDPDQYTFYDSTWSDFLNKIKNHVTVDKKMDAPCFTLAEYEKDTKISANTCKNISAIVIDSDNGRSIDSIKSQFGEYESFWYTTHSHLLDGKTEKWRGIVPVETILVYEYLQMRNHFKAFIGNDMDTSSLECGRLFFVPSAPESRIKFAKCYHFNGKILTKEDIYNLKLNAPNEIAVTESGTSNNNKTLNLEHWDAIYHTDLDLRKKLTQNLIKQYKAIPRDGYTKNGENRHHTFFILTLKLASLGYTDSELRELLLNADYDKRRHSQIESNIKKAKVIATPNYEVFTFDPFNQDVIDHAKNFNNIRKIKLALPSRTYLADIVDAIGFLHSKTSLLSSPPGTGKTFMARDLKGITAMALPMICNVKQEYLKAPEVFDAYYGLSEFQPLTHKKLCTYDKVSQFNNRGQTKHTTLIVDEAHNMYAMYGYRAKALNNLYKTIKKHEFSNILLMSATIDTSLLPNINIDNHVTIIREENLPKQKSISFLETDTPIQITSPMTSPKICYLVTAKHRISAIEDRLVKDEIHFILYNNKEKSAALKIRLEKKGFTVLMLNADEKNNDEINEQLESETINEKYNVILVTTYAVEGLSFNNPNITTFHIYERKFPAAALHQLSARSRKPKNPVKIFQYQTPGHRQKIINLPGYNKLYKEALQYSEVANSFLKNSSFNDPTFNRKSATLSIETDRNHIFKAFKDHIRPNYQTLEFEPSDLGIAHIINEIDSKKECHRDSYFISKMNDLGWEVVNLGIVKSKEASIKDELEFIQEAKIEAINEVIKNHLRPDLEKYDLEQFHMLLPDQSDMSISAIVYRQFYSLINALADPEDAIKSIKSGKKAIQEIFDFNRDRRGFIYFFLSNTLKVGDILDTATKHKIIEPLNRAMKKLHGKEFPIKRNDYGQVTGKSSSAFLNRFITLKSKRIKVVKADGSKSTKWINIVTSLQAVNYKFTNLDESLFWWNDESKKQEHEKMFQSIRRHLFPDLEHGDFTDDDSIDETITKSDPAKYEQLLFDFIEDQPKVNNPIP